MPGRAPRALPPPEPSTVALAIRLERHVRALADEIGARHVGAPDALAQARHLIAARFRDTAWDVDLQTFEAGGVAVSNIEARIRASAAPCLVVGAHYDTVPGTPGANDNGTGVAALLELAAMLPEAGTFERVRLVAFVNEEPPWFQTAEMGSTVYAARARAQGDQIDGMLSLETIGYYSEAPGSQRYPAPLDRLFPDTGHFLGAVSDLPSAPLLRRFTRAFRAASPLPLVGAPSPAHLPGVGWSDHWSFWRHGYRALMLTDTAPFRYPHYHQPTDTPDRIDYIRLAFAVEGIAGAIAALTAET